MKKGFTLVELLAVIVIVGIISSITFVVVDKTIKDNREKLYEVQLDLIYDGAESWVIDNISILKDNTPYCIQLNELQNSGYVEKGIINPKTDSQFSGDLKIKITETLSGYSYTLVENSEC